MNERMNNNQENITSNGGLNGLGVLNNGVIKDRIIETVTDGCGNLGSRDTVDENFGGNYESAENVETVEGVVIDNASNVVGNTGNTVDTGLSKVNSSVETVKGNVSNYLTGINSVLNRINAELNSLQNFANDALDCNLRKLNDTVNSALDEVSKIGQ